MTDQNETLSTFLARHVPGKTYGYRLRDIRTLGQWVLLLTDGGIATFDSERDCLLVDHKSGYHGHWSTFPAAGEAPALGKIVSVEDTSDPEKGWIVVVASECRSWRWRWHVDVDGRLEELVDSEDDSDMDCTITFTRGNTVTCTITFTRGNTVTYRYSTGLWSAGREEDSSE